MAPFSQLNFALSSDFQFNRSAVGALITVLAAAINTGWKVFSKMLFWIDCK